MKFTYDEQPDKDRGLTIVIVDDEEIGRRRMEEICEQISSDLPVNKVSFPNAEQALEFASNNTAHLLLIDKYIELIDGTTQNGIKFIPEFLHILPNLQILVVSGSKEIDGVVEAINNGALGYITKDSSDELVEAQIRQALLISKLSVSRARLEALQKNETTNIASISSAMRFLMSQVEAVSETNKPVLLLGQSGTGKTTFAKYIHQTRQKYLKQEGPYFDLNLSALSPNLIEAELFGYEKGAFTGADKMKQGIIELVNNGTLFLDEIGEISPELQVKLLKVLEEGTFYRLGGTTQLKSSFKLICATNKNLKEMMALNQFREDLFWRISTFTIEIPSLAERKEDIPEIIKSILPKCCRENKVHINFRELPQDFIEHLMNNPPKGNIRGLEQYLHYLLVYSPKDRTGKSNLSRWRKTIKNLENGKASAHPSLVGEIESLSIDITSPDFPGLKPFLELVEEKILKENVWKFKSITEMSKYLKLSQGAVSVKMKTLKKSQKPGVTNEK